MRGAAGALLIAGIILIAGLAGLTALHRTAMETIERVDTSGTRAPAAPRPVRVESRSLVFGDTFWGRLTEREALAQPGNRYEWPFARLATLDREAYDNWITNVECPISDRDVPFEIQWEAISLNCRPEFVPAFARWFNVAGLSNNHTDNAGGEAGLLETRRHLEGAGIQHFGHYDNRVKEDICEVVALNARTVYSDGSERDARLPVALCGYHGVFRIPQPDELAVVGEYAKHLPVIAVPHAGAEYVPEPDSLKRDWYRTLIDNGADMVIGGHPHWVQSSEVYKGKLIMYSLGNAIFDQRFNDEVRTSAVLDLGIAAPYSPELAGWLGLAEGCAAFKDGCLEEARRRGLGPYRPQYAYDVIATKTTDLQTARGDEAVQAFVRDRLRWDETLRALGAR